MDSVNQTMYIPLYGKAYVSRKGLFLNDKKAEEIWAAEEFPLKGKSKSKWLAYYMGIRSAVFDNWVLQQMADTDSAVVIHIGCGMDSRVLRIGESRHNWYDIDFSDVIAERKRYYSETERYKMIAADVRDGSWLSDIPEHKYAIVVMEGVSMYLTPQELQKLLGNLQNHFEKLTLLMDCYSEMAAKMSKYKNPINEVGVTRVYGMDTPEALNTSGFSFVKEHDMTPQRFIDELTGIEKRIFTKLYAGNFSKSLYRLYEYWKS